MIAEEFLDLACLCYDDPHYDHRSFHSRAKEMLLANPELSLVDIWCAAAAGDASAASALLQAQPELANQPGPHGWAPLICACYSRAAGPGSLQVATLLLDHGADPRAFTMKGNTDERFPHKPRRFTALTGVFGGGSTGIVNQPPHPQWRELAELLLARGADPADEQALAINQDACLELLLRYGLQRDALGSGSVTLMGRALYRAARRGNLEQVQLLLSHNARTDETVNGSTAWEQAIHYGHIDVAKLLEQAGAPVRELDQVTRFLSLCLAGDERAREMARTNPELLENTPPDMVHRAVSTGRAQAVKLVLELGFDPNYQEDNPPITQTGELAQNEEMLRLLLAHGASLKLRDRWYDSTAIGWAHFMGQQDLRDRLFNEPGICLFDALDYDRLDLVPGILARDPEALQRPFAECLSRDPKPEDWQTPLARMQAAKKASAVAVLLQHGANAQP